MTPAQQQLVDTILERFGPKTVTTDPHAIEPWESDWRGRYHGRAPALLSPRSTEEVAAIVRLAGELGVRIVPQGGNTGMVGGATPPEDGSALLLSPRRMTHIRSVDTVGNLAVVEAGVILANFHDAMAEQGRRFPLTLGAKGSATIGGLVSTNAGGTQVLRFGNMRHLVAGVEAVLPDGSIHEGLVPLKKDNRGYDLTQLLIGAEGTIGIVTAATLRLYPAIVERAAAWVGVADPEDALRILRLMEARTATIESFEIIPGEILGHVLHHIPGTRSPLAGEHAWHVLIESVATEPGAEPPAALLERLLVPVFEAGLAEDAVISTSEAQVEAFWHIRDSISEAERALGPAMQHDISVPVDKMPRFMLAAAAEAERRFPGTRATAFGHLGDGNVHFHVRAPQGADRDAWYAGDGPAVSRLVYDMVVAEGGSISAEHGIGQMKRAELERLSPPSRIAALKAIKSALDPRGILNPGKLVALAPDADTPQTLAPGFQTSAFLVPRRFRMASAPQQSLPLFYNELEPLSSQQHADFKIRAADKAPFLAKQHAVPVTVEEFPLVQRFMPIVFSQGEEPVPLALMGLNEGINTFFDDDGSLNETNFYVPAYIRRYPYLLARLRPDSDELSLCFDPTSDTVGAFEEGEALFVDGQPSDTTKNILQFNEQFEQAGARTGQFMKELKDLDLLIDGEVTIQPDGAAQPFVYRGFMMVDENKLNEMRGDQLRKIVQNGMLPLIYAHLFSLGLMRDIFGRQLRQGKMPEPQLVQPNA